MTSANFLKNLFFDTQGLSQKNLFFFSRPYILFLNT